MDSKEAEGRMSPHEVQECTSQDHGCIVLGAHDVGEQGGPLRLRAVVIEATDAFSELGLHPEERRSL